MRTVDPADLVPAISKMSRVKGFLSYVQGITVTTRVPGKTTWWGRKLEQDKVIEWHPIEDSILTQVIAELEAAIHTLSDLTSTPDVVK